MGDADEAVHAVARRVISEQVIPEEFCNLEDRLFGVEREITECGLVVGSARAAIGRNPRLTDRGEFPCPCFIHRKLDEGGKPVADRRSQEAVSYTHLRAHET